MRAWGEGGGGSFWVTFWLRRASFWGSRQRPQGWGGEPVGTCRDLGARPASAGRLLIRTLFLDTLPPHPFPLWRSPQVDDPSLSGRPPAWTQGCPGVPRPASSVLIFVTVRLPGAEGQASPSPPLLHGCQFWVVGTHTRSSPLASPPGAVAACTLELLPVRERSVPPTSKETRLAFTILAVNPLTTFAVSSRV